LLYSRLLVFPVPVFLHFCHRRDFLSCWGATMSFQQFRKVATLHTHAGTGTSVTLSIAYTHTLEKAEGKAKDHMLREGTRPPGGKAKGNL